MKHLVIMPDPGKSGGFVEVEVEAVPDWAEQRRAEENAWACAQAERDRAAVNAPIHAALAEIDVKSVRPLRAILEAQTAGVQPDPADVAYLADLKAQADALRAQLVA